MDESNPYLDLIQQDSVDNIRQSLQTAVDKQPDAEAKLQSLAKQYSLPVDAVRLDTGTVERRAKLDAVDYDTLAKSLSATGNLLSDPKKAAIAHDDIDNLSALEQTLKYGRNAGKALASGIYGFSEGVVGQAEAGADLLGNYVTGPIADVLGEPDLLGKPLARDIRALRQNQRDWREYLTPQGHSNIESGIYSGLQSLTQNVLTLPLAIATDNPNLALNSMAAITGGQSYGRARDKGVDPAQALAYGAADAAIEYGTEQSGLNLLFKDLKVGSSLMKTLTNQIMPEMVGEQAATVLQDFNEWSVLHPEQTLKDYTDARPDAAIQTAIATAIGQGGMVTLAKMADSLANRNQQRADSAHQQAATLEQINQFAAASKVMQRDPDTMKGFIDEVLANSDAQNVYIDAKSFAQSGVAEQIAEALPDVKRQLPEALAIGGEIKIPMSDYVTRIAATQYAQPLIEHIRLEGEEFSRASAAEYMNNHAAELQTEVERVLTHKQTDQSFQISTLAVKDTIKQQLATVSRFTDRVNDHYASLLSNFYAVQAEKFGKSPEELFQQYPVNVASTGFSGNVFGQVLPDAMPEGMEQGDGAKAAAMYRGEDKTRAILLGQANEKLAADAPHLSNYSHSVDVSALDHIRNRHTNEKIEASRSQLPVRDADIASIPEVIAEYDGARFDLTSNLGRPAIAYVKKMPDGVILYMEEVRKKRKDLAALSMRRYPATTDVQQVLSTAADGPNVRNDGGHDASIDEGGDQVYNQRRRAKRDDYTLDLFDIPAEAGKADNAGTETGWRLSRDDVPAGTYGTRTQIVQENTRQLGTDHVNTPEEAAQALAYLANSTVERFDALITDKDGKPLAIVGSFKGAIGGASVYPATVAGEAFRIEGAAHIWFGHNHPSGINELSNADRNMNQKLSEVFRGSQITPRGIFAIAGPEGEGRKWVYDSGQPDATDVTGTTTKPAKTTSIPVVERVYAEEGKLASSINAPDKAKTIAQDLSNGESGVLLMDNQHAPVAFIPVKSAESEVLRSDGRMDALHRGLSMANATAAIIVNQGDMTNNALMNLAGFFNSNEVRVLDVLDKNGDKMDSRAEAGLSFSRNTFNQGEDQRGAFNPATRTITLLDKADLSTFLHEAGHFFLEMQMDLASNLHKEDDLIGTTPAQKQLIADTDALLKWFGLQSIEEWYALDFEQKRSYHERFAEGFEKYLFEGNAPSLELARIFASFRQWMKKVYEHVRDHFKDIELSDEVRGVFDRMLATDEEIKLAQQARSMMPLFADQAQSGMTPEEYAEYQAAGKEATSAAMEQLALKGLRDMQWLQNARNRELKKLQQQHDELRREVRSVARMEVMAQPIYQAYSFLTRKLTVDDKVMPPQAPKSDPNHVDASQDSLFVAIAKLGGLQRSQLTEEWNYDHDGRGLMPVFGKPLVRKTGGHSIEAMAEMLLEEGYLTPDRHGKHDLSEFEQKFSDELRGVKQYSFSVDGNLFREEGIAGSEIINPEGLGSGRFELAALQGMFIPEEAVNQIVNLKMTARDGLHPDIVSELFGFSSGDELVKALAAAPSPKEAIEQLTDERMLQNYGELSTPEAIQRAADMAIHNEVRARFITTEANALAQATGSLRVLGSAAKEFAAAMIGRIKVRDISPTQYARAEVRAAKAALKAEKAGKLDVAAAEKRNQIINIQATRAAYQAQDDIDAGLRYFRKLETENKAIDPEYKDQIYRELERFDLRKVTNKQLDRRKSLAQWVESQKEQGYEPDIPIELMNEATKISYKDMTVEEFRGLVDTIKQIEHLGRLKNQLLTAKKNRNFDEVKQEIFDSINRYAGTRIADTRTPTTNAGRMLLWAKNFYASHVKAATWARALDGGQDGGAVWEYFIRSANHSGEYETTHRADATEKLTIILNPVFKLGKMGGKGIYFPSINRSLNREMRLAMALNTGNDGNLQRLLDGEGWTIKQITPVLQTLTAEEWQAVQQIWDYFDTYRPEIGAKERRVYGKEPNWVEPKPVIVQCKTAAGVPIELRLLGGYYPIKYDPLASQRAEQHADAETAKSQLQGAYTSATTRRSFTKNRSEMILGRPLLYSLSGVYSGINEVIHDLAWHEWLIDMNKLLKSNRIDRAIRGHYGPEVLRQFKSWTQDIAGGDAAATNAGEIALGRLRQGISAAGLGFNTMSAAMQVLGLTQSIVRVGAPWMGRGISRFIGDPKGALREVNDKSEFMRNRSRTQFREINELRNRVHDETAAQAAIRSGTFFMMMKAQQMVDVPTWLGAYDKAIADLNEEERAIALADQAVIDAQGGGQTKDLSAIERGGPALRLFTVFYSFMNTAFNLGVSKTMTEKSKAKLAADYLMLYSVPAVLGFFLKQALTPGGGDDDWEELSKKLLAQQIDYLMGLMVIVREFSEGVKLITGANDMGRDYQGPAGLRLIADTRQLAVQVHQGEFDDAFRKAAINVIGDLSGLPSAQVNRTISGAEALNEGKTENLAALVFGFRK